MALSGGIRNCFYTASKSIKNSIKLSDLYFIALIPPADIREAVRALKKEMQSRFGAGHALKSPAHITLQMPFKRTETEVPQLLEGLASFAARQAPFSVGLSGFDCFAPRVIFIRVEDHRPVAILHDRLQGFLLDALDFQPGEMASPFYPHMTIATRDLREAAFHKAWAEFEQRPWEASFVARSLFLLKHNGRFWEIWREFGFGGEDT